ncbi:MAG TPA: hypothetical protein VHW01_11515 [Polyangiaceae bacterium]|jgi:hypothetical protein|nr:hypothetical protein [Polyangiaceae bacterium]
MLLVCSATKSEHEACALGIRDAGARGFESLLVGVGPRHAARRLRERLASGPAPSLILSCGFAGALAGELAQGTWIMAETLSEWTDGALLPITAPAPLPVAVLDWPHSRCDLVSADHLIRPDSPLCRLASIRPLVADMESAALAREAAACGVTFSVARLVSDTPDHPLPEFLSPFTAALASSGAGPRFTLAARGIGSAFTDPRGVARLLSEGRRLTKQLRTDFRKLAQLLDTSA